MTTKEHTAELEGELMTPVPVQSPSKQQSQKKRKLKHPRTAHACTFCRRRKIRCSGDTPSCKACKEEQIPCEYTDPPAAISAATSGHDASSVHTPVPVSTSNTARHNVPTSVRNSCRNSLEPPETFDDGLHVGPTSGVSFLYQWQDAVQSPETSVEASMHISLYGDMPQPKCHQYPFPTAEEGRSIMDRYFRFATPTYRFFHRPTLEAWMQDLVEQRRLPAARMACVLVAWAQALLYSTIGGQFKDGEPMDLQRSRSYFETAKQILDHEPGPAQLASVQARLAMCLYLVSTSRINECRYLFGFTNTLVTSLGLHRKSASKRLGLDLVESEGRKRAFWSMYVLDGYLSVMLGRPRLFRDEDIDQPYPLNIDDAVMQSSEKVELLPHHGNLEAFVHHAKLARLMGRNSDLLYPLTPLTEEQILHRAESMVKALDDWKSELPAFLQPRASTLTGSQTWERQNTVLKLAFAHMRILATRRCILTDFTRLGRSATSVQSHASCIRVCVESICTIIDTSYQLMQSGRLYASFWFTQYIALCAISTLYVYKIQYNRGSIAPGPSAFDGLDEYFLRAEEVQGFLSEVSPVGSQAKRHHVLLDHLRNRANRPHGQKENGVRVHSTIQTPLATSQTEIGATDASQTNFDHEDALPRANGGTPVEQTVTPAYSSDFPFQDMLSWQSLDQLGFVVGGDQFDFIYTT